MKYTSSFYDYVDSGAKISAEIILSYLFPLLRPTSVLDVGCGRGTWLRAWREAGASALQGVDGDYVDRRDLRIESTEFHPLNVAEEFDFHRQFDIVQCLEVAEHIPARSSEILVENLVRHGRIIFFSAAQPGQGGTQHVNEQSIGFWYNLFRKRGYQGYDYIRPRLHADTRIEPWYRFNTVLYADEIGQRRLPSEILATLINDISTLPDFEPFAWRLRRAVFRHAPVPVVDQIARVNAMITRLRRNVPA